MTARIIMFPAQDSSATAREAAKVLRHCGASEGCVQFVQQRLAAAINGVPNEFHASGTEEEVGRELRAFFDEVRGQLMLKLVAAYIELYEAL
jgi:hypothetical protein